LLRAGLVIWRRSQALGVARSAGAILVVCRSSDRDGWEEVEGALQREFRFNDFAHAVDFVNRVAEVAERANHHPEIIIRWNRVTLRWRTQTAGAVTRRDIELAGRTNELV
jgi:4a-hydroxytetrahydrobiopterin dehydratase